MSKVYNFLLKSQANELFGKIATFNLSPEDFTWKHGRIVKGYNLISLSHSGGDFYFDMFFSSSSGQITSCRYSPAPLQLFTTADVKDWISLTYHADLWLSSLGRELTSPDFWSELSNAKKLVNAASEDSVNTPFNQEERKRISENLNEIKQHLIKMLSPDDGHMAKIEADIDYLREASNRLGRKDWKLIVISTLATIAIDHTDKIRGIFSFTGNVLQWLYHHGANLLGSL